MKSMIQVLILLALIYLGICIVVYIYQDGLLLFPSKDVGHPPSHLNIQEVLIPVNDGIKLHSWFLDNNSEKTVLFFHGNAGNISDRISQIEVFDKLQLNALMIDYRGFGKSGGKVNKEQDLFEDGNAAWLFLTEVKGIPLSDIIIWGRSLGGAIALDVAQDKEVSATILESTFYSMDKMARKQFWFLPVKLLSRYHLRNDRKIDHLRSKLLVIHSSQDEIIPYSHGRALFIKAIGTKEFLEIKGSHNEGFQDSMKSYFSALQSFLKN